MSETPGVMGKGRLEAFTDGVVAIIITIMVLELKTPNGFDFAALRTIWPTLAMYAMSFVYVGIYWNNHHHLMHAVHRVNGAVLWANLHLLFWLSLVPFTTRWMGEGFADGRPTIPVAVYGVSLLTPAVAYSFLVRALITANGKDSAIARAIGGDLKGYISLMFYVAGIAATFWQPWAGVAAYVTVAAIWFLPDRRIEKPR